MSHQDQEKAKQDSLELLEKIPAMIAAVEKKMDGGKQSLRTKKRLEEIRQRHQQAQSQQSNAGEGFSWLDLYLLLNIIHNDCTSVQNDYTGNADDGDCDPPADRFDDGVEDSPHHSHSSDYSGESSHESSDSGGSSYDGGGDSGGSSYDSGGDSGGGGGDCGGGGGGD